MTKSSFYWNLTLLWHEKTLICQKNEILFNYYFLWPASYCWKVCSWRGHKVFGSFLKKFQRRKKFFAYVFDVDNGGENRIYRQGLHFETVLKHLLKRVNEYDWKYLNKHLFLFSVSKEFRQNISWNWKISIQTLEKIKWLQIR